MRPEYCEDIAKLREALDNSQSLLVMLIQIGDSSEGAPKRRPDGITREEWETEGLTKLLVNQISDNRAALTSTAIL